MLGAEFLILLVLILAGFAGIFWFLSRKKNIGSEEAERFGTLKEAISNLIEENKELKKVIDAKLSDTHKATQTQLEQSVRLITDVTEKLTKLDETNKQIINFSSQLQNLQDILKNPKRRGILGEYYLETLLKNVLPPGSYEMQYQFPDGLIADAVIFVKEKIIPIDSKFSLENYNRIVATSDEAERERLEKEFRQDLKARIDETSKYVKPEYGTMDFAFMFIPAEAIYYDLLVNKVGAVKVNTQDLIQYAFKEKHVIIVSPTSFLAYLQTVLQGLRALQIEESAKEIRKRVEELGKHLLSYESYMKKLGTHLGTAVNTYNTAYKELGKIDKDVFKITGEKIGLEPSLISAPSEE
jgi:DNA recombination protein RmuC